MIRGIVRTMVWGVASCVVRVSYDKLCLIYYATIYDRMLPYGTLYDQWSGMARTL